MPLLTETLFGTEQGSSPSPLERIILFAAQALWQLAALGATLAIALVGGTVAGAIVAKVSPTGHHLGEEDLFEDALFWCGARTLLTALTYCSSTHTRTV